MFAFNTVIVGPIFLNLINPETGTVPSEPNVICETTTFDTESVTLIAKDPDDVDEPVMKTLQQKKIFLTLKKSDFYLLLHIF